MHYTDGEPAVQAMLRDMGLSSTDELFKDVPSGVRAKPDIPAGLSEMEAQRRVARVLGKNRSFGDAPHFLGAGMYHHWVPPEVPYIATRSEFLTSYTPYQAEISQGILQAMFEFQSAVCALTEMDAANISMYDGATAFAEAALMAHRITDRAQVLVPRAMLPDRLGTLRAYAEGPGVEVVEYAYDPRTGQADIADIKAKLTDETAAVCIENPSYLGVFEEHAAQVAELAHAKGALSIVGVSPVSLGLVKGPGAYGADIVVGEGQPWGNTPSFGGPALGLFACRKEHLRQMPGRIVGQTKDKQGHRAFCLTLQTREQHIRRDKATSNICTNEGLNALMAIVHLATLGGKGLQRVARINAHRAKLLRERIAALPGYKVPFPGHAFNEFVVQCPKSVAQVNQHLLAKHGMWGGLDLSAQLPELGNATLVCVTELHAQESIDGLVQGLKEVRA
ncbi:MAG: aminomethyl-transferring glycine dehydrogenase subunit GcvPA [Halobacteriales archaeon]|nr:aminomethyl-transferring glycine dehydrogenase subunit GcvPA [Halobacteriales archaeon]